MWLLDTQCIELTHFTSPEKAPPFAILSHTWSQSRSQSEQSFQEVQDIIQRCLASGQNPRDAVCEKIRRCCEIAEADGYRWVWIDTCCIDKTSSAELSEAINSMFRYYSLSRVCYVYLEDWNKGMGKHFDSCRWFDRGWTLQELIAPERVLFFDVHWRLQGSKVDFAEKIERVARVPASLLSLETSLGDYNVTQRMSWAAKRETTREEDLAYCLLGIFGIHMPTLYGEGRHAFRRLQEEILQQEPDPTLFAWGFREGLAAFNSRTSRVDGSEKHGYLLAASPRDFSKSSHIVHKSSLDQPQVEPNEFVPLRVSPYGVEATVPLMQVGKVTLADFGFRDVRDRSHLYLPLVVSSSHNTPNCFDIVNWKGQRILVWSPNDIGGRWEREHILIAHQPPLLPSTSSSKPLLAGLAFANSLRSPFCFHSKDLAAERLLDLLRWKTRLVSVWEPSVSWHRSNSTTSLGSNLYDEVALLELEIQVFTPIMRNPRLCFVIQLGLCTRETPHSTRSNDAQAASRNSSPPLSPSSSQPRIAHWARIDPVEVVRGRIRVHCQSQHRCDQDHISEWGSPSRKEFDVRDSKIKCTIALDFRPDARNERMLWMKPVTLVRFEAIDDAL